jgi:hypothetical protein
MEPFAPNDLEADKCADGENSLHSIRIGRAGQSLTISLIEPASGEPSLADRLARGAHRHHVNARIEAIFDGFRASYVTDLLGGDLPAFREALARLRSFESQEAVFETAERELRIEIKGDGRGHFKVKCVTQKNFAEGFPSLTFTLEFDQTDIPPILAELDAVLGRVA